MYCTGTCVVTTESNHLVSGYGTWGKTLIGSLLKISADPTNWGQVSDVIFAGNLNVPPFKMGGPNEYGWWPLVDLQDHNLSIVRRHRCQPVSGLPDGPPYLTILLQYPLE